MGTNLTGSVLVTRAAIDWIVRARGHVVFISSIAGMHGLPGAAPYSASKMALTALAESLRLELTADGVHVGLVYLGFTEHDPEKRILGADGSRVLPDRPAHHTQAEAADMILDMVRRRRRQLVMTPLGRLVQSAPAAVIEKTILFAQKHDLAIYRRFS